MKKNSSGWKGESRRHSLARKGIKTANGCATKSKKAQGKRHEFKDELHFWTNAEIKEFEDEFGKVESIEEVGYKGYLIKTDEGEYLVFEDYDSAYDYAVQHLVDMWETDEGTYPVDWVIENNIYISETDRRIIANEESDFATEDLSQNEILRQADTEDEWDELEERRIELVDEWDELEEQIDNERNEPSDAGFRENMLMDQQSKIQFETNQIEKEQEQLVEDSLEKLQHDIYEQTYDALEDPMNYFVREMGTYSKEELLQANFINVDFENMAKEVLDTDGVGHILSSYDGNEYEIGDTFIYVLDR